MLRMRPPTSSDLDAKQNVTYMSNLDDKEAARFHFGDALGDALLIRMQCLRGEAGPSPDGQKETKNVNQ